jgi:hypothetical protein
VRVVGVCSGYSDVSDRAVEFKDLLLSFGDIAGRADGSNRTAEQLKLAFRRYTTRLSLILQQGGFETNPARLFAEALAEDQALYTPNLRNAAGRKKGRP